MPNQTDIIKKLLRRGKDRQGGSAGIFKADRRISGSGIPAKHLDAVLFSLDKLNREAEKRKAYFLGVENRYYLHEIPDFDEIGMVLREFEGGKLRYWHDVGHAARTGKSGDIRTGGSA